MNIHRAIPALILAALLGLVLPLCAQEIRFLKLTTADGLPQNSVECFVQDHEGFMWIGTQDGLVRYDGHEMRVYRSDPADFMSLTDHFITALHVDSDGDLWVGTRNGLNRYDPLKDGFWQLLPDASESHRTVRNIFSRNDTIFCGGGYGVVIPKTEKWLQRSSRIDLKKCDSCWLEELAGVQAMYSDDQREVRLYSDKVTYKVGGQWHERLLHSSWSSLKITAYEIVPYGDEVFLLSNGIYRLDPAQGNLEAIQIHGSDALTHLNGLAVYEDELWFGTGSGLFILDADDPTQLIAHCVHHPDDDFSINYDFVHGSYQDRDGRIWVGTANEGLNIHDRSWRDLTYLRHQTNGAQLPEALAWSSLLDQSENLWVGTSGGLALFPQFDPAAPNPVSVRLPGTLKSLVNVRDVAESSDGKLWFADSRKGLHRFDPAQNRLRNWPELPREMTALSYDAKGGFWAGSYAGLYYQPPGSDTFINMHDDFEFSTYIMSVAPFANGVAVTHTLGVSLFRYSPNGIQMECIISDPEDASTLPFGICSSFLFAGGKAYVGMYDRGVAILDENMQLLQTLDERDGLAGHVIEGIAEDHNGNIWIATNQGLSRYVPSTGQVSSIGASSGLRNQEFALDAIMKGDDGWMYFGSVDGLLILHPDSISFHDSAEHHSIAITGLQVNYKDYRQQSLSFSRQPLKALERIALSPNERVFSVQFSALEFEHPEDVLYSYMLEGFDEEWVNALPGQRQASYSNLPAGEYSLRVKAEFANGTEAAMPLIMTIEVFPPMYETWWFRLTALLLVLALVIGVVRYISYRRYRAKLRHLEAQQRLQSERERISRDLHDSVGSQITYMISSLDHLSFKSIRGGQEAAGEEINELGDFARDTMQQLREAIWVINKNEVQIREFQTKLEEYCQKFLHGDHLPDWNIELKGNPLSQLAPGAVLHLFRICQEAINNAVKHAKASIITIRMEAAGQRLHLVIEDDGEGFDASSKKQGHYGLDNMEERAKQMGGTIAWRSKPGEGTRVLLEMPIND